MAHEILSVKLYELERQLSRLSSRIHLSEIAGHERLQQEIAALERENAEVDRAMKNQLRQSHAACAPVLAKTYTEIEQLIQEAAAALAAQASVQKDPEAALEEQILLAEYALDFALQTTNHALLLSLQAIENADAYNVKSKEEFMS